MDEIQVNGLKRKLAADFGSGPPQSRSQLRFNHEDSHRYGDIHASGNTRAYLGNVHGNVQGDIYGNIINTYQSGPMEDGANVREECLSALLLSDPFECKEALKDRKGDRAKGTCDWFLESEEFRTWCDGDQRNTNVFWLHGHPGTGKSTLSIFIVEALLKQFRGQADITFCYFFCDANSDEQNSAVAILRGLLYQLCTIETITKEGVVPDTYFLDTYLVPQYRLKGSNLFTTFSALSRIFQAIVNDRHGGKKLFLVDALDECDNESQNLLLRHLSGSNGHFRETRLLVTSRPYTSIQELLHDFPNRDIASFEAARRDVDIFIAAKISELTIRKRYTAKLRDHVLQTLTTKAEGTFLWVGLACKELDEVDAKDCLQLLNRLPTGLDRLYADLLDRALEKAGTEAKDMIQVLKFVSVALSPITLDDLSVACRLYEQEETDERRLFTQNMVDSCGSMVIIIDDKYVRLLHKSIKDFLFKSATEYFPSVFQVDAEVASRCVDRLIENHENHVKLWDTRMFPATTFVEYATRHWPDHAHLAADHFKVLPHQRSFFGFFSESRERWFTEVLLDGRMIEGAYSIFHVVAEWGLLSVLESLKSEDCWHMPNLRLKDCRRIFERYGGNPLVVAAATTHVEIFEALLDVTILESDGRLMVSSSRDDRHLPVVQIERYHFPVTDNVIIAAAENYEAGPAILKTVLAYDNTFPIDEARIQYLIEHTNISKECLMILLAEIGYLTDSPPSTKGENALTDCDNGTSAITRYSPESSRSRTTSSLLESVVKCFDAPVVDRLLCTVDRQDAVTMSRLLEAATGNPYHGNEVIRSILAHSKVDMIVSYEMIRTALAWFDADLVRRLIAMADIEIDKGLLVSATVNQQYEVISAVLQSNPQIPVDEHVLKNAMSNKKFGKDIIAQLLSYTRIAFRPSVELVQMSMQRDVFCLEILGCFQDVSVAIQALRKWIEGASSTDDLRNFYDDLYTEKDTILKRGRRFLSMILEQQNRSISITADLLYVARKTAIPQAILTKVFRRHLTQNPPSPTLLTEAATWLGRSAMQALLGHYDHASEAEIVLAFRNPEGCSGGNSAVQSSLAYLSDNDAILAVSDNDIDALKTILQRKPLKVDDGRHATLVLTAVENDSLETLQALLRMQRDLGCLAQKHGEALSRAITRRRIDTVMLLLAYGIDVNTTSESKVPVICTAVLSAPAAYGDANGTNASDSIPEEILRLLIKAGADVNARNGRSSTALQIAARLGNLKVVKMLLAAGVDLNAGGGWFDDVLVDAAFSDWDSPDIIRVLIQHGATFDTSTNGITMLDVAIRKHNNRTIHLLLSQWSWPRRVYEKLLLLSCADMRRQTIGLLLRHGVGIDAIDDEGQTCLHRVISQYSRSKPDLWFINVLIDAGSQINRRAHDGQTVLHRACRLYGRAGSIVTHLLDYGADIEQVDVNGCTALHTALYAENIEAARLLLHRGARKDSLDHYGISATQLLRGETLSPPAILTDRDTGDLKFRIIALIRVLQNIASLKICRKTNPLSLDPFTWDKLSRWLFHCGQPDEALTAVEQSVYRTLPEPKHRHVICDKCNGDLRGIRHKCGLCDDYDLCDECWTEPDCIPPPPCCIDHKTSYIHGPGPTWKDRPTGVVNDKGESIETWFARIEKFCSEEIDRERTLLSERSAPVES